MPTSDRLKRGETMLKQRAHDPSKIDDAVILFSQEVVLSFLQNGKEEAEKAKLATALSRLSVATSLSVGYGRMSYKDGLDVAKRSAEKAYELQPKSKDVLYSWHRIKLYLDRDLEGAEGILRELKKLDPKDPQSDLAMADVLVFQGKFDHAITQLEKTRKGNPKAVHDSKFAWVYYFAQRYKKAIKVSNETIKKGPTNLNAQRYLGWVYRQTKEFDKAKLAFQKINADKFSDKNNTLFSDYTVTLALAGEIDQAKANLEKILNHQKFRSGISNYRIAQIYVALKDKKETLSYLERALKVGDPFLLWFPIDPLFDDLRSRGDGKEFLRRLKGES